jgi:hypothetical protein
MIDMPLLKKIKMIQANDLKTWKGLPVEYISRPGLLLNAGSGPQKRQSKTVEHLRIEDERFKVFLEGLIRYREWEEERMNTVYQF